MKNAFQNHSTHTMGVALVLVSALVFSTAGIFTKGVSAGSWEVIFWRGVFAAAFTTIYIYWRGIVRIEFARMGAPGWAAALIGATGTAAFIAAFKITTIANVMLIYAAAPLLAALLAWLWVGEKLTARVAAGCVAAFIGVVIIVSGSVGGINLRGDLLALWMTIAMSILMVIYRRYPDTPAAGPAVVSSLALLPPALWYGAPFGILANEMLILAGFGLVFAVASVTLGEGVKRLSAGETALLSTLETPLAPLFGWLFFAEIPAWATVIGGGLIFTAVISTQIKRKNRKEKWLPEQN